MRSANCRPSVYPYESLVTYGQHGLVPYAYDPDIEDKEPPDEDVLHDPDDKRREKTSSLFP